MKKIIYTCTLPGLLLVSGCSKQWDIPAANDPAYTKIYLVQASKIPVYSFPVTAKPDTILLSAGFGGVGTPEADVEVSFTTASQLVDSFNKAKQTAYLPLPEGSYELGDKTGKVTIPAGKTTSNGLSLIIRAYGKIRLDKEYLLPVSISGINRPLAVNESLRTAFLVIKPLPVQYTTTNWQLLSISSEEATGEASEAAPDNGKAVAMFDSNTETFWHSRYMGSYAYPPHVLAIDMQEKKLLSGITMVPRQGRVSAGGNFKNVRVEVSINGTDWESINNGTPFEVPNNDDRKFLFFTDAKECRYFRISLPDASDVWGNTIFTHCAELGGF